MQQLRHDLQRSLQMVRATSVAPRLGATQYILWEEKAGIRIEVGVRQGQLYYTFSSYIEAADAEWFFIGLMKAQKFFEENQEVNNGQDESC